MKVVIFSINGTHTLENLRVDKVVPKHYSSVPGMPVWAVENTGMKIRDVKPIWGIVDPKYKDAPHLWTIQRENLWLPAGGFAIQFHSLSSLGLLTVPSAALEEIHTMDYYSGKRNFFLLSKWRKLCPTEKSVGSILNLIWDDTVANNLVGTKSMSPAYGIAEGNKKPTAGMLTVGACCKMTCCSPDRPAWRLWYGLHRCSLPHWCCGYRGFRH
ncbi:hypothetical protein HOY80DRAFT_1085670 [Tuber brumale]|nr:hypothetical protein HOY80DRAFT_1085670 [Tuber brumale]